MFAVKGWSVSADTLKTQEAAQPQNKRKRSGPETNVTVSNVAHLWGKVIEPKDPKKKKRIRSDAKHDGKRQKLEGDAPSSPAPKEEVQTGSPGVPTAKKAKKDKKQKLKPVSGAKPDAAAKDKDASADPSEEWEGIDAETPAKPNGKAPKPTKEDRESKKPQGDATNQEKGGKSNKEKKKAKGRSVEETAVAPAAPAPASKPAVKLTPLQAAMREKLISARFRHLNETLYTRPSKESFKLFEESPEMFTEYHEGFRRQVGVWPENPVLGYIGDIQARGKQRFHPKHGPVDHRLYPLPRTQKTCTIADLGCGDAALAAALQKVKGKLHLDVKSFDLHTGDSGLVTKADIANLPLRDASVDVVVFCLALMGTNWVDFIEEAYRVLRWKGELWVAEIKSRFVQPGKKKVVEHSVGNRRNPGAGAKKPKAGEAGPGAEREQAELSIEVDGAEDHRQETDVSAFVEVLAKRGFVLRGEASEAVDMSNKMFVKMYFVKGAPATKGKCVDETRMAMAVSKARPKQKFISKDGEEDDSPASESSVLKPCLYKVR